MVAAIGLGLTLLVAGTAPASAAGLREGRTAAGLVARALAWLESYGLVRTSAPRPRQVVWAKEGSAINPDGRVITYTTNPEQEEGSAINPDGWK